MTFNDMSQTMVMQYKRLSHKHSSLYIYVYKGCANEYSIYVYKETKVCFLIRLIESCRKISFMCKNFFHDLLYNNLNVLLDHYYITGVD